MDHVGKALGQEGARMVLPPQPCATSEFDQRIFDQLVSPDHYLRRAREALDFEQFRPLLTKSYSPDHGAPAVDPVRMLKIEFLQYHDNLSDRQVIERATTDVAYRYFLDLGLEDSLPDSSTLSVFRGRLGVEGHRQIFMAVVAQAREHGLVKDRLRLKDATHIIADVALPTTLALIAQVRNKLLAAAAPWEPVRVEGERARMETIRQATDSRSDEERLVARVTHLCEILAWADQLQAPSDPGDARWETFLNTRQLAHKILAEQADPKASNRTLSTVDPDARCGKHGQFYDGYLLDVMMDADSEIITAIDVLPANGDEAANAAKLVRQEEEAQGNDIQALSIDRIAFNGSVLRELEDPNGLALNSYVPPKTPAPGTTFRPEEFTEDRSAGVLFCPGGQSTSARFRNEKDTTWVYRFARSTCIACPLLNRCMAKPPGKNGRAVHKNDYEEEYRRMREKAGTPEFAAVRAEHPRIERKLSELVRWHGARRARYRGQCKVLFQALMTAVVVNTKRIVRALSAPEPLTAR